MNKLRIRKLGILSVAKIYAVMMLVMSLLISIPYGLIIIVYSLFGAGLVGGDAALAIGGGGGCDWYLSYDRPAYPIWHHRIHRWSDKRFGL